MASSEAMTSSTRSFAYSYRLVKKCFVKICETSKCHNFLIFQPIFSRFSLFCSQNFTLSSKIKLNLFRSSPLKNSPYDIVAFAETHCDDTVSDNKLQLDDFDFIRKDRTRNGGGVILYIKKQFGFQRLLDIECEL